MPRSTVWAALQVSHAIIFARSYRCRARRSGHFFAVLALGGLLAGNPTGRAAEALSLETAQQLALDAQPLLEAQRAAIEAQRERAVAAGQLPDPELQFGISELPVNTADAWSLTRDMDTDVMVGIVQALPRPIKRRLQRSREELRAEGAASELRALERQVRREAGLAFLALYYPERAAELAQAQLEQAQLERAAIEIRLRSGTAQQSQLLAAQVEIGLLRDRAAQFHQAATHARQELARWIGEAAAQPTAAALPQLSAPPPLEPVLQSLREHPAQGVPQRARDVAEIQLRLAQEAYKPDWRMEVGYGYRPEFSEMLTVRAAVDLPFFTRNRQDREAAAARREIVAADARIEDRLRELTAEASAGHHNWEHLIARSAAFDRDVLPPARARVEAATAAYRTGSSPLSEALLARRALLEAELQALALAVETHRSRLALQYFLP